jgi:hypothetical protein
MSVVLFSVALRIMSSPTTGLLDEVGLLSAGHRQSPTMVMAPLVRRDVLLDEHLSALDPATAACAAPHRRPGGRDTPRRSWSPTTLTIPSH